MGKKILLADDSITIQKVIELTFSDEDFEVVTVGNGRLALERIEETRPDLVLCDIIMPEKDGYEVCDVIKKNPALSHIPVLLLTGAFEPFDQDRAARVGCDGFLAKPFEPQTLIAKVKDLLSRAEAREASAVPAPRPPSLPAEPPAPPPAPSFEEPFFASAALQPAPGAGAPEAAAEPEVQFIPEESFAEGVGFPGFVPPEERTVAAPVPSFPEPSPAFEEYEVATFDEVPAQTETVAAEPEAYPMFEAVDAEAEELLPMTDEEAESLAPGSAGSVAPDEEEVAPWLQPTVEVPLEDRAQASMEAAQAEREPFFEEVFEEEPSRAAAAEMAADTSSPPEAPEPLLPSLLEEVPAPGGAPAAQVEAPMAAASPVPEPAVLVPERAAASFAEVAPAREEPAAPAVAPSVAAEVPVPVDMVSQIAQRVVAQISEKVIREIAWEVIPDLAEALIRKEIERLKAELAQT